MSMQALKKAVGSDPAGWHIQNRLFNEQHKVELQPLEYFAMKAAEKDYGIVPEERELQAREERCLRRFRVQPWEYQRGEKVRRFARDTYALEKYWEDHDCPWAGPQSPTVQKAFSVNESLSAAFPAFVQTFVQAGRLATPLLERLVQDTIPVIGKTAQHAELTDTATTPAPGIETAEGARTEQVTINWQEREIRLRKLGYEVLATYEAVQWARLPVLARALERVGRRFQYTLTEYAIEVLISGDGSTPTNVADTEAGSGATTDYSHYLNLYFAFPDEYVPDLFLAGPDAVKQALGIAEFKDPLAGGAFQNQGTIPNPLGIPFVRWRSKGISGNFANDMVIAIDTTALGLVEYTAGGILSEAERLIRTGWSLNVTTLWVGFGMIDPDSRIVGTNFG